MNELSLQSAKCTFSQSNIGETIIHNICDMSVSIVPWGSMEWLAFTILSVSVGCLIGLIIAIVRI